MTQKSSPKKSLKRRGLKATMFASWLVIGGNFAVLPVTYGQTPETEYALAAGFYARQQWTESAEAFGTFISDHPSAPQAWAAHFFLGEAFVQQQDFASAYPAYQQYLNQNYHTEFAPRASFRLGECAYRTGNTKAALRALEAFIADHPKHELIEFALPYLGELRLTRSEPQLAQAAFEAALKFYPSSELSDQSRVGLAKSLQNQGAMEDAQRLLTFVVSGPETEFTAEANLHLGIIKFKQADFAAARIHLREAIAQSDGTHKAEAGYWLSRTEMATDNHADAVKLIRAMTVADLPTELGAMMLFDGAVAATKIEDNQTAVDWLSLLRDKYPDHHLVDEALLLELNLVQQSGNNQRVLDLANEFNARFPDNPATAEVAEIAGRTFYVAGDFENTVATYRSLLSESIAEVEGENLSTVVREKRSRWLYLQSLGLLGLKQYDEAVKELDLAEAYNEDNELATLIDLAYATAHFGNQQYSKAVSKYHSFLSHHDQSNQSAEFSRAACELSICFNELERWDDARDAFQIMKSCDDTDQVMQTTQYLAEQAYDAGQKSLASEYYAYMASPDNDQKIRSQGLSGLAWVYMESTDDAASPFFTRLISEYPDSSFSSKATMARAKYLESQNDIAGANALYRQVSEKFPTEAIANVARLRQANLLHKSGNKANLKQAQGLLKDYLQSSAEKTSPDEALYLLGWVMNDLGDRQQAMIRFERLIEQHTDSKYWPDAAFRIAQQQLRADKQDEAVQLIDQIVSRDDAPPEVVSRSRYLKSQLAAAKKDWPTVATLMRQVIKDGGETVMTQRAKYWLAEALYQQQMYNEASQQFAGISDINVLERSLQPWVRLRMAQCLGKLERWDDAAMVADDALHQYGDFENDYEFVFVMARAAEARGLFDDAETLYTEVIESANGRTSETSAISQWRIGEMHFHKEDYKTAIEAYYRVDSLYDYPKWRTASLLQAGKCQEHLGNWKHAAKLYSQILKKYPDSELATSAAERLQLVNRQAKKLGPDIQR